MAVTQSPSVTCECYKQIQPSILKSVRIINTVTLVRVLSVIADAGGHGDKGFTL